MKTYSPIVIATALALYNFNQSPVERAEKLYKHFDGECMGLDEMIDIFMHLGGSTITELPYPTAKVYLGHALERYGEEAEGRCLVEQEGFERFSQR